MKILAIIQARLSSHRLPGKVLIDVQGRPLLDYLIARLRRSGRVDAVVLATSGERSDDRLSDYAHACGVSCVRGVLEDVVARYRQVLAEYPCEAFARINADSPWIEPDLLDQGIALYKASRPDLVTNLAPRSYPYGISVEILKTKTFQDVCAPASAGGAREHITDEFYKHPNRFTIVPITQSPRDASGVRLVVDTPEDLRRFRKVVAASQGAWETWNYRDVVRAYETAASA